MPRLILPTTKPAPVIATLSTGHVITARDFHGAEAAPWALHYILSLDEVAKFGISHTVTRRTRMVHCTTLKTHGPVAIVTECSRFPAATALSPASVARAIIIGAPL